MAGDPIWCLKGGSGLNKELAIELVKLALSLVELCAACMIFLQLIKLCFL